MHQRVAGTIDRTLFGSVWRANRILDELAGRLNLITDAKELVETMQRELSEALGPVSLTIYVKSSEESLTIQCGEAPADMGQLRLDQQVPHPDDCGKDQPRKIEIDALERITQIGPDCLVPIVGHQPGLLGLIVVGARDSGEPYATDDRRRLTVVAARAGQTLERIGSI